MATCQIFIPLCFILVLAHCPQVFSCAGIRIPIGGGVPITGGGGESHNENKNDKGNGGQTGPKGGNNGGQTGSSNGGSQTGNNGGSQTGPNGGSNPGQGGGNGGQGGGNGGQGGGNGGQGGSNGGQGGGNGGTNGGNGGETGPHGGSNGGSQGGAQNGGVRGGTSGGHGGGMSGGKIAQGGSSAAKHFLRGLGKGGHHCLHRNGQVYASLSLNETLKVHEIAVGDRIIAYSNEQGFHLSPVIAILHRDLVESREFLRLSTASGKSVAVTAEHGVFSGPCGQSGWKEMRADDVKLGDCLKTTSSNDDAIVQIGLFTDAGAVQPITETGTVVVDNIVVSCYDYEEDGQPKATNPHDHMASYRMLYELGDSVYQGLHGTSFAADVLQSLIKSAGLEKLYELVA